MPTEPAAAASQSLPASCLQPKFPSRTGGATGLDLQKDRRRERAESSTTAVTCPVLACRIPAMTAGRS